MFTGAPTGLMIATDAGAEEVDEYNLEALAGLSYELFRYDDPELDLATTLFVFPGLTSWGRVRVNFDSRLRYEVFNDFYVGLSFFDTYDSDPPVAGVEKNDYGLSTSIGWYFK